MEQVKRDTARIERELRSLPKLKPWLYIGGIATAISATLKLLSPAFAPIYFVVEASLAVACIGYALFLPYRQKQLEARLGMLRARLARRD